MKIRSKFILSILFSTCIALTTISVLSYFINRDIVIKTAISDLKDDTYKHSAEVAYILKEKIKISTTIASSQVIAQSLIHSNAKFSLLGEEERNEKIRSLNEKWIATKDIKDAFIQSYINNPPAKHLKIQQEILAGEYGEIFLTNRFGSLVATTGKLTTLAHTHKYWWQAAYNSGKGKAVIDDRGYDESVGDRVVGIVVPVMSEGRVIGILKSNLLIENVLSTLNEYTKQTDDKKKHQHHLSIVRTNGDIVLQPEEFPADNILQNGVGDKIKNNISGSELVTVNGKDFIVAYLPVNIDFVYKDKRFSKQVGPRDHRGGNTGEDWYIFSYLPLDYIFITLNNDIKNIILTGLLLAIILIVTGYILSAGITAPIKKLTEYTERIGKGDFNTSINISSNDEIGNFAAAFDIMRLNLLKTMTTRDKLLIEVAERKKAGEELKKSEEEFRSTLNDLLVGVVVHASDTSILLSNPEASNILGLTYEQMIGKKTIDPTWNFLHDDSTVMKTEDYPVNKVLSTKKPIYDYVVGIKRPDRDFITWGTVNAIPTFSNNNELEKVIVNFIDITERRQLEEEKQKRHKIESIGTLAGGIAHDFNNILAGILNNIYISKMYIDRKNKAHDNLESAEKAISRATSLTNQLLTFSRGGAPIRKTSSIIEIIKESAEFALKGSTIKCEYNMADDLMPVEVDKGQMNQVIHNLILNAIQSMPEGGTIRISTENSNIVAAMGFPIKEGRYIKVTVQDHGAGISAEHLQNIFDPYFTTKKVGRGLGLSIIYSIIKRHDGHISAESELGVGTTFTIYLPASEKQVKEEPLEELIVAGKGKILLMDDEKLIRASFGEFLRNIGFEVEFAENGEEAIALYKKAMDTSKPFDAAILDLTIRGGMGGKEAIKKLHEIDPKIKAIVSTGYSNDPVMANYKEYGFSAVVYKASDNPDDICRILNKVLESHT